MCEESPVPATPEFVRRVILEKNELFDRITKLSKFIDESDTFDSLSGFEQDALCDQLDAMTDYFLILCFRIGFYTKF